MLKVIFPSQYTHTHRITRTDKQNHLQTPKCYLFSVLWDPFTVPGQQLFVIYDDDIPLRPFLLICFSLLVNAAD